MYRDTQLFYEVHGQGRPWVLLHGFLESSSMWKNLIPELSKDRKLITIDLPGHGKSECHGEVHSMEAMADAVHEVLQHLEIKTAVFLGHSMGGYVALAYVENYSDEVEGLVLMNSTPKEDSPDRKKNRDRALKVMAINPKAFIGMAISNLFAPKSRERYAKEIEDLKHEALQFPIEGIMANIKGMKIRKDRTEILKKFDKSKLLICGKDDPIVPIASSEEVAKICGAKITKIAGGHMSHIENLDKIVKTLHFID